MIIGFTGTQQGMTWRQKSALFTLLWNLGRLNQFHHGDCVGADKQARDFAKQVGMRVVQHPPTDNKKRAFCDDDVILKPLPYLQRNHAIVLRSHLMIAAPRVRREELRSGTWATIRYAKKVKKELIILDP